MMMMHEKNIKIIITDERERSIIMRSTQQQQVVDLYIYDS